MNSLDHNAAATSASWCVLIINSQTARSPLYVKLGQRLAQYGEQTFYSKNSVHSHLPSWVCGSRNAKSAPWMLSAAILFHPSIHHSLPCIDHSALIPPGSQSWNRYFRSGISCQKPRCILYIRTNFRLIVRSFNVPKATLVRGSYALLISAYYHNSSGLRGDE